MVRKKGDKIYGTERIFVNKFTKKFAVEVTFFSNKNKNNE